MDDKLPSPDKLADPKPTRAIAVLEALKGFLVAARDYDMSNLEADYVNGMQDAYNNAIRLLDCTIGLYST